MEKTIRLQPATGKFLQTSLDGQNINIWLVDPKTNQQGTDVPYKDAIRILAFKHPVATVTPVKGKDGKFINMLTDEDRAAIEQIKREGWKEAVTTTSSDNSALEKVVEQQSEVIKTQMDFMTQMKTQMDDMQKQIAKLTSKPAKPAKAALKTE